MNKLYHFTKFTSLLEDILPNQRLLMNYIINSNDPWENQLFSFDPKWKSDSNPRFFNYLDLQSRLHEKIRLSSRVISFSTSKVTKRFSNPGYNLSRMWAQYADNHKGICIIVDKEEFIKENIKNFDFRGKVKYQSEINTPILDESYINPSGYKDLDLKKIISKFHKEIFFTKLSDWKGENEYRIINYRNPSIEYCSINKSLYGIIMGIETSPFLTPCIVNLTKLFGREIHLYKAYFNYKFLLKKYTSVFESFQLGPYQIDE
jgi:hypothetical protein